MGNKSSLLLRQEEIAQIQEDTGCKCNLFFVVSNAVISSVIFTSPRNRAQHNSRLNEKRVERAFFFLLSVTPNQIERLYSRFTSLDRTDCGTLSREDFLRIPELAINPLCDRIVHAFFADSTDDRVNFRKFMQVLAHFRPIKKSSVNKLNNREQKLRCRLQSHLEKHEYT